MPAYRQELLLRLGFHRRQVFTAVDGMTEAMLLVPPSAGAWSAKDVLGHLGSWERTVSGAVEQLARGVQPAIEPMDPEQGSDARNHREVVRKRGWPVDAVLADLHQARERLLETLGTLTDAHLVDERIRRLLESVWRHDAHHVPGLRARRRRQG